MPRFVVEGEGWDKIKSFLALGGELVYDEYDEPVAKWHGHEFLIKPERKDIVTNICHAIDHLADSRTLYNYERTCQTCREETRHEQYDDGHERDSSNNYTECLKCRERKYG